MSAIPPGPARATIADVLRESGRAELIGGVIVRFPSQRIGESLAGGRIFYSLSNYADATGRGNAYMNGMGFAVPELRSGRESFAPNAAYYIGPLPTNRRGFVENPPTLAVEILGWDDGQDSEREMGLKRSDYFQAGTLVVWHVDPEKRSIACYRSSDPAHPQMFHPGDTADAEPAVPGWCVAIDWIFQDLSEGRVTSPKKPLTSSDTP